MTFHSDRGHMVRKVCYDISPYKWCVKTFHTGVLRRHNCYDKVYIMTLLCKTAV